MNILVFGAGAIGSLFAGCLSKNTNVFVIARKPHAKAINNNGLRIIGKTELKVKIKAFSSVKDIGFTPDLLMLTVKSYDTESAIKQAKKIIGENTVVMSLQNGLDNIEKIIKHVDREKIVLGTTAHGAIFSKPGLIEHTGLGKTTLGGLDDEQSEKLSEIADLFNQSQIATSVDKNIICQMWTKAVINSSINPLTTFFKCKNGYLLENMLLKKVVEKTCKESTAVANSIDMDLSTDGMIDKTMEVLTNTKDNYSSMLQSYQKKGKTEIDSINGKIVETGQRQNMELMLNNILIYLIKNLE